MEMDADRKFMLDLMKARAKNAAKAYYKDEYDMIYQNQYTTPIDQTKRPPRKSKDQRDREASYGAW